LGDVGTVQVPHHGALRGFSVNALEDLPVAWSVCAFGSNNAYGHPSYKVLGMLQQLRVKPVLVTERAESVHMQLVRRS